MPTTEFRLVSEGQSIDIDLESLQYTLPPSMRIDSRCDGVYVVVDSVKREDETTQKLIDRELDRVFFYTCVRLRVEMCRRTVRLTVHSSYRIHGHLPDDKGPQNWTDQLALQLKLWSLASDATDVTLKILLYFQIIELSFPLTNDKYAYPPYTDESIPPNPRTEAKLLRHLVAHAGKPRRETVKYLRYLGMPPVLSNLNHPLWGEILVKRCKVVELQARKVLENLL